MKRSFWKSQVLTGLLIGLLSCLATSGLSATKATTPVRAPEISKWDAATRQMARLGHFPGPSVRGVACSTVTGKAVAGAQGWQNAEGDGAGIELDGSITLTPNSNTNLIGQKNPTNANAGIATNALHFANLSAKSSSL